MSALPPEQMRAMRSAAEQAAHPAQSLADRWETLHAQAAEIASLAQLAPEETRADRDDFSAKLGNAQDWQCELAWQSIEDIDAMMQPGITALKVLTSRGINANAPALALWREFHAAREGVLSMLVTERRANPRA